MNYPSTRPSVSRRNAVKINEVEAIAALVLIAAVMWFTHLWDTGNLFAGSVRGLIVPVVLAVIVVAVVLTHKYWDDHPGRTIFLVFCGGVITATVIFFLHSITWTMFTSVLTSVVALAALACTMFTGLLPNRQTRRR